MSIRSEKAKDAMGETATILANESGIEESGLGEGNSFCVASPDNPLKRQLVVSIRASLNDLCLRQSKGIWSPSSNALKSVFQQRKFTSLDGSVDQQGDLKAVVLHDLSVLQTSSTFPVSLGTKITCVDDCTYSSTGEPFSMIVLPHSNQTAERKLQSDDVSLAYEFAKKFPGYTAENLSDKGIHEVSQRRFVLVTADHPIVSAISENAERLQMGEISMMPEGLVKISQGLYESILPLVKTQVESQIKVRDLSRTAPDALQNSTLTSHVRLFAQELMVEAKRPLMAHRDHEIAGAVDDNEVKEIRAKFAVDEKKLENDIDHKPMEFHASLGISYNFLSK